MRQEMIRSIKYLFLAALCFFFFALRIINLSAAESDTAPSEGVERNLMWRTIPDADHYVLNIEKEIAGIYSREFNLTSESSSLNLYLPPGNYRYQVTVIDGLGISSPPSAWGYFSIEQPPPRIVEKIIEVPAPIPETPQEVVAVEEEKPGRWNIALGYAPSMPLFGRIGDYLGTKFLPIGMQARFGFFPVLAKYVHFALELEGSYINMVNTPKLDLFSGALYTASLGASLRFPIKRINLGLRGGGGLSFIKDFILYESMFGSSVTPTYLFASGGLFMELELRRNAYLNLGADFLYFFTADKPQTAFLRPWMGTTVRF
jgi:hypothetical protein